MVPTSLNYVTIRRGHKKLADTDTVVPADVGQVTAAVYPPRYAYDWKCEFDFGTEKALLPTVKANFVEAMRLQELDFNILELGVQADARLCVYREDMEEYFTFRFWTPTIVTTGP